MHRSLLISLSTLLVIIAGAIQYNWVKSAIERESHEALDGQWASMKGLLLLEYDTATHTIADHWYFDSDDPDQAAIVSGIRAASLIADEHGQLLRAAPLMRDLGLDNAAEVIRRVAEARSSSAGNRAWFDVRHARGLPYLVKSGIVFDERHRSPYYVSIAVPLSPIDRRWPPFLTCLGALIAGGVLLGWSLRRGVSPAAG